MEFGTSSSSLVSFELEDIDSSFNSEQEIFWSKKCESKKTCSRFGFFAYFDVLIIVMSFGAISWSEKLPSNINEGRRSLLSKDLFF